MSEFEPGWYVRSRGRVLGPFPFAQLETLKQQGRLAKFDDVSTDRKTWVRASSLPELFPPPAPPPEPVATSAWAEAAQPVEPVFLVAGDPTVPASGDEEPAAWYYMKGEKGETGPVLLSELVRLARVGAIRGETLVWHSDLTAWTPARSVPALGLPAADTPAAVPVAAAPGGYSLCLAGFILGILGLVAGTLSILTSVLVSAAARNREILAIVFLGLVVSWGISSLLAVILSPVGMARASKAGAERRGFGLGLTGMVLGILGLVGFLILVFLTALGMIAAAGAGR